MSKVRNWTTYLVYSRKVQAIAMLVFMCALFIINIGSVKADTIFDGLDAGSDSIVTKIADAYCNNLFAILLVIALLGCGITAHNQKLLPIFTKALKVVCIIFVALKCLTLIEDTFTWISEQFTGGGGGDAAAGA